MSNVIEIKAMSQEAAITRALKVMEATPEQVVRVYEKQKSRSFFGFFNKEGIYEIEIDKSLGIKNTSETKDKQKIEIIKEEKIEKPQRTENIEKIEIVKEEIKDNSKEVVEIIEEKVEIKQKSINVCEKIETKAKELLEYIGLDLQVDVKKINEKNYVVELFGEDNGIIIGKKGKTLNSFEYLLNSLMKDYRIEVDVEGFKEKRTVTLRELGKKMAEKALKSGKTVRLNPMPPRERKIIHEVINRYPELDTFSEGRDPKRYIVIKKKK